MDGLAPRSPGVAGRVARRARHFRRLAHGDRHGVPDFSVRVARGPAVFPRQTRQFIGVFGASGATLGTIVDLDADGDLDIGDNATAAAVAANVSIRSAAMTTGNADGLGASEFNLYQFIKQY